MQVISNTLQAVYFHYDVQIAILSFNIPPWTAIIVNYDLETYDLVH